MFYRPGYNSDALAAEKHNNSRLKKLSDKKHSEQLKELGKVSVFREEFEGIKLENQVFPQIPSVENIVENKYFIEGRKFGYTLIANGFTEENYNSYNEAKETKKHR